MDESAISDEVRYLVNLIRYNGHNLQQARELTPGSTVLEAVGTCTSESKACMKVQCAYEVIVVMKPEPVKASNRPEGKT